MKKTIILLAVASIAVFGSCKTAGKKSFKTESDSLSYAIGLDLGYSVKRVDSTLNVNIIAQAMKDVMANKPGMTQEDYSAFINEYFQVRKPAKIKAESAAFISGVEKSNKKAIKTASGLVYEVIAEGGEKATSDMDTVVVNYKGTLPNEEVFDSSYDRGEPATFPLNQVIPAWTEGMKLVGKGGKITLWAPSDIAYGEQGTRGAIGPNQALKFEVEIIDVRHVSAAAIAAIEAAKVKAEADAKAAAEKAEKAAKAAGTKK